MQRVRAIVGIVAGVILLLSSAAHGLAGWPRMRARLVTAGAPADLVTGLGVGWLFGSVCILVFAILAIGLFGALLRGRAVRLWPMVVIATAYTIFGIGALVVSRMDLFFLVFIVPGVMLLGASAGGKAEPGRA